MPMVINLDKIKAQLVAQGIDVKALSLK